MRGYWKILTRVIRGGVDAKPMAGLWVDRRRSGGPTVSFQSDPYG
jgi:hypothetical protein